MKDLSHRRLTFGSQKVLWRSLPGRHLRPATDRRSRVLGVGGSVPVATSPSLGSVHKKTSFHLVCVTRPRHGLKAAGLGWRRRRRGGRTKEKTARGRADSGKKQYLREGLERPRCSASNSRQTSCFRRQPGREILFSVDASVQMFYL